MFVIDGNMENNCHKFAERKTNDSADALPLVLLLADFPGFLLFSVSEVSVTNFGSGPRVSGSSEILGDVWQISL